MKKLVVLLAALFVVAVTAPAFAQQAPAAQPPAVKGTEGPDVKKASKKKTASSVAPKGTEGPDVKKVEPKGTEGPDVKKAPTKQ